MLFNFLRKKDNIIKDPIRAPEHVSMDGESGMVVEDVFSIRGRGTVVTGRAKGMIHINDVAQIVRDGHIVANTTIVGIEAFRKTLDMAQNGDNVGLLLEGIERSDVAANDFIKISERG